MSYREISTGVKFAIIDTRTNTPLLVRDTEAEAELSLATAFKNVPAGRIEAMGIRIFKVVVSLQILPDTAFIPAAAQQLPLIH